MMEKRMTSYNVLVSITKVSHPVGDDSILAAVREAVNLALGDQSFTKPGARVVIKPNIFAPSPAPRTTDPRVVAALVKLAVEAGAGDVIVAEGRSISTAKYRKSHNTTRACAELIGMPPLVEAAGGRMLYLEEDEFVEVDVPGGLVLKKAHVPRTILDADVFINVPVMKIHSLMQVTLGIKNLHGCLSDEDKLFGHSYNELAVKLSDFLRIRNPDLTVLDGLVGQEGDHAEEGKPVEMGLIIASRDVVALDAITAAVMGLMPDEVDTTRNAGDFGLGEANLSKIQVLGESVESVRRPFARPDVELYSGIFPGVEVIAGESCRSCQYYIRRGVDKLVECGLLDGTRKLTIIMGKEPPVPDKLPGNVIMLGDCCLRSQSVRRLRDYLLLEGRLQTMFACPPMEFRIRATEFMGD